MSDVKKIAIVICAVILLFCIVGVGVSLYKTKIEFPSKVEFYNKLITSEEPNISTDTPISKFIDKWGKPVSYGDTYIWEVPINEEETKYLIGFNNSEYTVISCSIPMYVTIVSVEENIVYGIYDFNSPSTDIRNLIIVPITDCFGNTYTYTEGEVYIFETDGIIMSTYPGQIGSPFSIKLINTLSSTELINLQIEFNSERAN